jgi:TRAP-type C4-dicarboxylate transport system permease small subunit
MGKGVARTRRLALSFGGALANLKSTIWAALRLGSTRRNGRDVVPIEEIGSRTSRAGLRTLAVVAEWLAVLGGLLVLSAALLVCISVGLRWATNDSVPGDFEFVQIAVALSAFAFLPFCQAKRGNIFVDTFTARLPVGLRNALDAFWDTVYAGSAALIAWRLAVGAGETIANQTTTMVSGLPIGWAIALAAVMAGLLTAVAGLTAVERLWRTHS